jgi:hypothetical protein
MSPPNFSYLLSALLVSLPGLLVCFIGVVLVLDRWRSLGPAALPAMLGLVVLLLVGLLQPLTSMVVPMLIGGAGRVSSLSSVYTIISGVFSVCRAAAYLLLILGIIQGRQPPPPSNLP